jgi:outer membrane protein TolC
MMSVSDRATGRDRWGSAARLWAALVLGVLAANVRAENAVEEMPFPLDLETLRRLVIERNERVQMQILDVEISEKLDRAERGIFEPQLTASVERFDTDRPNNTQQQASLGFFGPSTPVFLERNTFYNAGIEFLTPIGTRLRTGFTLRELGNNLQYSGSDTNRTYFGPEIETFLGASVVQPLLRNFGTKATMAKIRLAALASDVAFQEYRRQLMLILAQAESGYWELYLAQERARIGEDSVTLSERILADNRSRFDVGAAPELEVAQAQAGVSLRRARWNEGQQGVLEVGARLANLYATTAPALEALPRAVEEPRLVEDLHARAVDIQRAFEANPDYLMRQAQLAQEGIRVSYTRNQRFPQLDLRASYGLNGLGRSIGESLSDVDSQDYPAWSVGVELRVPLGGGVRERNEHRAAKLAKERALLGLKEVETQIFNGTDSARRRLRLYAEDVHNYRSVVGFHERLLDSQLDQLSVGAIESVLVLETEERLSQARVAVVEALVLYRRAALELELIRGTLLAARNLEVTQEQLRNLARQRMSVANLPAQHLEELERRAAAEFDHTLRRIIAGEPPEL